jgi:hypothetical protein
LCCSVCCVLHCIWSVLYCAYCICKNVKSDNFQRNFRRYGDATRHQLIRSFNKQKSSPRYVSPSFFFLFPFLVSFFPFPVLCVAEWWRRADDGRVRARASRIPHCAPHPLTPVCPGKKRWRPAMRALPAPPLPLAVRSVQEVASATRWRWRCRDLCGGAARASTLTGGVTR